METILFNGYGKEWDFAKGQRMEFYISRSLDRTVNSSFDDIIQICGKLLTYGGVGSKLYDLVLEVTSDNVNVPQTKNILVDITRKIKIYDFIIGARKILSGTDVFGSDVLSLLMRLIGLVVQSYNRGALLGVISRKQVVMLANTLDPFEVDLSIMLELTKRKELASKVVGLKPVYDTDRKRYNKYLRTVDTHLLSKQLEDLSDNDLVTISNNILVVVFYSYNNNLFNEVDDFFLPDYSFLQCAVWEREDTVNNKSVHLNMFSYVIEKLLEKDVLKTRDFYVRDKGVRIVFKDVFNGFKSIEVREYHDIKTDEHYINIYYTIDTGDTRMLFISMSDISGVTIPVMFEKDADAIMIILKWLGILDTVTTNPLQVFSELNTDLKSKVSMDDAKEMSTLVNSWIANYVDNFKEDLYYYETPRQWNYTGASSKGDSGFELSEKPKRIVKVGRYTRRLPVGQNVSAEARALANKYFIELKEGYTIVEEFERKSK